MFDDWHLITHLVLSVLLAVLALAVGAASLGNVDLRSAPRSAFVQGCLLCCAPCLLLFPAYLFGRG